MNKSHSVFCKNIKNVFSNYSIVSSNKDVIMKKKFIHTTDMGYNNRSAINFLNVIFLTLEKSILRISFRLKFFLYFLLISVLVVSLFGTLILHFSVGLMVFFNIMLIFILIVLLCLQIILFSNKLFKAVSLKRDDLSNAKIRLEL